MSKPEVGLSNSIGRRFWHISEATIQPNGSVRGAQSTDSPLGIVYLRFDANRPVEQVEDR
jgi:hypothetical protein